jgi:uncharacterized membrane protein YdfJ with MMPL/SSD domain
MQPQNLASRVGRWSAQHRKAAIFGWILFVVLAVVVGGRIGQNDLDESAAGSGESKRGDVIVEAAGFPERAGEQVLVQGTGALTARDPEVTAAARDVVRRLERIDGVTEIESPLDPASRRNTVSKDGRSVVVNFAMPGSDEHVEQLVEQPLAAVAAVRAAHPDVRIEQFGEVSATKAIAAQDARDGKQAQLISYALLLIILLVAFGAVVAAGLPLVLGASAVAGTVGLLGPVSQLYALPADVAELVVIIGLAVGVDYAMFYSRRVMEERDRGHSVEAAVQIAAATSGRAVLVSGMTVLTAMAGLLFAGNPIFVGIGIGTMIVVAVAMPGSLTFLPAMLAFLSRKNWLEKGRMPYITKRRHAFKGESRVWGAILTRVLKRPLASTVIAGGLLVALCIPALGIEFKDPGFDGYSRSQPVIQTHDRLQAAFPGGVVPATVVIKADDVTAAPVQAAIEQLHHRALATGQLSEPSNVDISPDKTVAVVGLSVKGSGTDAASERSLHVLRSEVVPATVGKLPGAEVAVTGVTAGSKDFIDAMTSRAPIVFAFVLSLAFVLLLVTFPLDRRADQGDRPQPAVGRRRLRHPRARLPGRPRRAVARLPVRRRHRPLDPALPLRDPLRPLDGLPRVHPQPRPRGRKPRHEQRRRGRPRSQEHRRRRDQRRAGHGRGLRLLHACQRPARQADRRRPRRRDPDRRNHHPRRPAAGQHEAARPAQLVPAQASQLAAEARPRAADRAPPRLSSPQPKDGARPRGGRCALCDRHAVEPLTDRHGY